MLNLQIHDSLRDAHVRVWTAEFLHDSDTVNLNVDWFTAALARLLQDLVGQSVDLSFVFVLSVHMPCACTVIVKKRAWHSVCKGEVLLWRLAVFDLRLNHSFGPQPFHETDEILAKFHRLFPMTVNNDSLSAAAILCGGGRKRKGSLNCNLGRNSCFSPSLVFGIVFYAL